jgi:spore coat protein U-like protein
MRRLLIATTALIGVVVAQDAWAATATSSIGVSAGVDATCTVSATRLAFHSVATTTVDNSNATVTVTCTSGANYDVGLDYGLNAVSTQRFVKGVTPANTLPYNLFQDSSYSIPWGNNLGVDTEAGTGSGGVQVLTVYGQIPSQSTVASDTYSDTITVTLTY